MLLASVNDYEPKPIHPRRLQDLASNVIKLLDMAGQEVDRDRGAAKASIARACTLLQVEILSQARLGESEASGVRLAGWQVERLKAFIESNLDQPIRISELSQIAKRSPSHFCHAFKRTFGQTPHAYVTSRRVDRAGELMLKSDALLTEIAYNCGFTDQAHLSKLFRQRTGQAPSVWRRERRDASAIHDHRSQA